MKIRYVTEEDAPALLKLFKELDASEMMLYNPGERRGSIEPVKSMIHHLSKPQSALFVAEVEQQLAGYLTVQAGGLERIRHRAYITLGVSASFRGMGIASALFNSLFTWAADHQISRLELTVIKHNKPAFDLYRKMGFVLEGEKVHSLIINGEPVNEYYLYKLL
ncbi:GNAT family N-acetyltransferase [Alkalihalophilus pseudofirmus]|uniref:GNAT family N-acetyltransferase n=1 Tax=Alkalihalophilus pseudofirmus TaxID=79885 RepID=UPI000952D3BF|nr:GNAT family N-acetyltransferase [Alkalihalophilus pseudofirmus]